MCNDDYQKPVPVIEWMKAKDKFQRKEISYLCVSHIFHIWILILNSVGFTCAIARKYFMN